MNPGESLQVLPAPDFIGDRLGLASWRQLNQHGIDVAIRVLRCLDGLKQTRYARAIQRRIGRCSRPLIEDGIVVLKKLGFLSILQRYENHGVAAGRNHAFGQADDPVVVPTNPNAIAQLEPGFNVSHSFVMVTGNVTSGNQVAGLSGLARFEANDHRSHIGIVQTNLHGQISHVGGASHARKAEQ